MSIDTELYRGNKVLFTGFDHDADSVVEASWTHNPAFMRMQYIQPMKPQASVQVKKQYEEIEKACEEDKDLFHFQVRLAIDNSLIGFCQINSISWSNRSAAVLLGIGDPANHRCGFGTEILSMATRFAFDELNLERLSCKVPAYNVAAIALAVKNGFSPEGQLREAIYRDMVRWDLHLFGKAR